MRIKISRKESKESRLWLKHFLTYSDEQMEKERIDLIQESIELENILGAICRKLELATNK
jgi:hypothetical protein